MEPSLRSDSSLSRTISPSSLPRSGQCDGPLLSFVDPDRDPRRSSSFSMLTAPLSSPVDSLNLPQGGDDAAEFTASKKVSATGSSGLREDAHASSQAPSHERSDEFGFADGKPPAAGSDCSAAPHSPPVNIWDACDHGLSALKVTRGQICAAEFAAADVIIMICRNKGAKGLIMSSIFQASFFRGMF